MSNLLHKDLTHKIIGCAYDVHNFLGPGFPEVVYQRALAYELETRGISFQRELELKLFYKDCSKSIGGRRADFLVADAIILEIKAIGELTPSHTVQTLNYLKVWQKEVGLLINFGGPSVEFKRLVLSRQQRPFHQQIQITRD